MKKRLRKKLHLAEFKELGFYVRFRLAEDINEEDLDTFLHQFLNEAIEAHGLDFGGGGDHDWHGFVALNERGSATEEHREKVGSWLSNHPSVLEHEVSQLRDVWYETSE